MPPQRPPLPGPPQPQPHASASPVVHTPISDDVSPLASHASIHTPSNIPMVHQTLDTHRSSLEFQAGASRSSLTPSGPRPYCLRVDPLQDDRAVEIQLLSAARPHMRAFHYSWLSFFIAFFGWFSIPPLLPTIKKQLHLTAGQVANANIAAVASTIVGRVVAGPLCDRFGPRVVQALLLIFGAVPVACAALARDYAGLVAVRFCIGLVGCSFVATTYWTSIMFSKEVVGSANALAAGWGNLGAGATYLLTPLIFDLVTSDSVGATDDLGWRVTLLVPAVFMALVGVLLYKHSGDCPHGNFADLARTNKSRRRTTTQDTRGSLDASPYKSPKVDMAAALVVVARIPATWILAFQYACSFGVELQMHNVLTLYYYEDFTRVGCVAATDPNKCRILTQTSAGLISSLFGLMCIFARAMGGVASDYASRKHATRGRIAVQFLAFAGQAAALNVYSHVRSVSWSVPTLILFGIFVQACTGMTFAIVPYVAPRYTGATSGLVGAGGNVGALGWGFLFKGVGKRALSFQYLSIFVTVSALLCLATSIEGEGSLWRRIHGGATTIHGYGATQRLVTADFEANAASLDADETPPPADHQFQPPAKARQARHRDQWSGEDARASLLSVAAVYLNLNQLVSITVSTKERTSLAKGDTLQER